jgi:hypothetical protein
MQLVLTATLADQKHLILAKIEQQMLARPTKNDIYHNYIITNNMLSVCLVLKNNDFKTQLLKM